MTRLLIFFSFFFIGCSGPNRPEFKRIENVKFNSFSIIKPYSVTFNADAIYYNSNRVGADITELDIDVYVNDQKVTHITQDIRAKIPGQSEFTLPLNLKVPLEEVLKDFKLKDILNQKMVKYEMKGFLKMGIGDAMVKVPFNYAGEESISL